MEPGFFKHALPERLQALVEFFGLSAQVIIHPSGKDGPTLSPFKHCSLSHCLPLLASSMRSFECFNFNLSDPACPHWPSLVFEVVLIGLYTVAFYTCLASWPLVGQPRSDPTFGQGQWFGFHCRWLGTTEHHCKGTKRRTCAQIMKGDLRVDMEPA